MSLSLVLMVVLSAAITAYYFRRTAKRKELIAIRMTPSAKQHRR